MSFKAGTDDLRESPVVTLIEMLIGKGMDVAVFDRDVSSANLIGSNREYIEKEIPHIWTLVDDSMERVVKRSEVVVIGNANPSFTLGVRNNAIWNGIDASWLWRGEFGGDVFNNTALVYASKSDAKQGRNFLRSALDMPDAIGEPSKFSSRWVESRTFVRLQNVTVGYALPRDLTAGRATRIYLSGDNMLLFTKYTGYDPEVFVASGLASRGVDYLVYPPSRRFTLGARVQF
jgi:iron complex outermembrane receptor protein